MLLDCSLGFELFGFNNQYGFELQAQQLNKDIFETIYYHALKASSELAAKEGPYETYDGCPVSKVCSECSLFCSASDRPVSLFVIVLMCSLLQLKF